MRKSDVKVWLPRRRAWMSWGAVQRRQERGHDEEDWFTCHRCRASAQLCEAMLHAELGIASQVLANARGVFQRRGAKRACKYLVLCMACWEQEQVMCEALRGAPLPVARTARGAAANSNYLAGDGGLLDQ